MYLLETMYLFPSKNSFVAFRYNGNYCLLSRCLVSGHIPPQYVLKYYSIICLEKLKKTTKPLIENSSLRVTIGIRILSNMKYTWKSNVYCDEGDHKRQIQQICYTVANCAENTIFLEMGTVAQ
jgi:hypothetical protein